MKLKQIALAAAIATTGSVAFAQSSSVTLYGVIDQNITSISGGGKTTLAMEDGGFLKSRLGFKGEEDLGGGLKTKFNLEGGGWANNGTYSLFNRQAWVGLGSNSIGEFRAGLQNSATFYRGDYIDYTSRTLGSVVNAFLGGFVPSRYANDMAYLSPRLNGVMFEAHYALDGKAGDASGGNATQLALDYENGPFRVGYSGNWFKPEASQPNQTNVKYDNFYANYDHGKGKVYAVYIKTNNNSTGTVGGNSGTAPSGAIGSGSAAGCCSITQANLGSVALGDFDIYQFSVDYRVTPALRVGALWGKIKDNKNLGQGATGESIGAYYDLSKRTMLYGVAMQLNNEANGLAIINGSNSLAPTTALNKGINQTSYSVGVVHRF